MFGKRKRNCLANDDDFIEAYRQAQNDGWTIGKLCSDIAMTYSEVQSKLRRLAKQGIHLGSLARATKIDVDALERAALEV